MRRAEDAALALDVREHGLARVGDVLAEHTDALVFCHLLVQRALDRLAERDDLAVGTWLIGEPQGRKRDDLVGHRRGVGSAGLEGQSRRLGDVGGRLRPDRVRLVLGEDAAGHEVSVHAR